MLAVILARGNSERFLGKNLQKVFGQTLIARCVRTCLAATRLAGVYVSSDSDAILHSASEEGATCIPRPTHLAGSLTSSEHGWRHALEWIYRLTGTCKPDFVGVQVTSPLLTSTDLDNALEAYDRYGARRDVFAASILTGFGVWQSLGVSGMGFSNDDSWQSLTYDPGNRPRSQEAPTLVIENGAFYIMSVKQIMDGRSRLARNPLPFIMPWWSAPEIDYPSDIELVEKLGRLFLK